MAPREAEGNAYATFWGDKQRALWYNMVFSGVVNSTFYRYASHIKLIRFREYYGMPRGHEHMLFVFTSTFQGIFS